MEVRDPGRWASTEAAEVVVFCLFFSSRRRHTRSYGDWSSDVCSSDLQGLHPFHRTGVEGLNHDPLFKPISPDDLDYSRLEVRRVQLGIFSFEVKTRGAFLCQVHDFLQSRDLLAGIVGARPLRIHLIKPASGV